MPKVKPTVAIITRTKNRNRLLVRALESIDAQTYSDYVHVILNDGGDKESLEKLLKKYPSDKRFVVHNEKSVGLVRALNQAIKSVDSKYICILDDDDTWHKDRLNIVIEHLENHKSAAAVVKMDVIEEKIYDNKIEKLSQYLHPDSGLGEISLYNQCNRNYLSNGIITYKRTLYDDLNGYDESLPTAEDWDFGIRLMLNCDVDLIRTKESLFYYHQRKQADGELANSVHGKVLEQELTINYIRNKYLRNDIKNGNFGIGYIMNSSESDLIQTSRIEGHINRVSEQNLKEVLKAEERIIKNSTYHKIKSKFKRK